MRALVEYIARLELAGGEHDGESFAVLPWERRFLAGAFRRPGDAALSGRSGQWQKCAVRGGRGRCGRSFRPVDRSAA